MTKQDYKKLAEGYLDYYDTLQEFYDDLYLPLENKYFDINYHMTIEDKVYLAVFAKHLYEKGVIAVEAVYDIFKNYVK